MIGLQGFTGAWNYTFGPALIYEGPRSLDAIQRAPDPVVVVAETLPLGELLKVDIRHIRGFVLSKGEDDDVLLSFLVPERRAAVLGCRGIFEHVTPGIPLLVDGVNGVVIVAPDGLTIHNYIELRKKGPPPFDREHLPLLVRQIAARILPRMAKTRPEGLTAEAFENGLLSYIIPFTGRMLRPDEKVVVMETFAAEQQRHAAEQAEAAAAAVEGRPRMTARERRTAAAAARQERDQGQEQGHDHDHAK